MDVKRAVTLMEEHAQHCMIAHNDNVARKCPECKRMMLAFCTALGLSPKQIHEQAKLYGVPEHFKEAAAFFNAMFPPEEQDNAEEGSLWD